MKRTLIMIALAGLSACSERHEESPEVQRAEANLAAVISEQEKSRQATPTEGLSDDDKGRVCRAIIASLNGRDPNIIRVISSEGNTYRVRYTRDDGTVWTNDCGFGTGIAQWRMVEEDRVGRWRTEDTIQFSLSGQNISVKSFMDGELVTDDSYTVR